MFAYCLNNPVNYSDEDGDRSDSIWGWIGEEIGELIYEWTTGEDHPNDQAEALETEIISKQNEMIAGATKAVWDAYMRSYNLQQEAQLQQAIAINNVVEERFSTPQKALETISWCLDGVAILCYSGGHTIIGTAFEMIAWLLRGSAMYEPEA